MKCRKCGTRFTPLDDTAMGAVLEALDACATCAPAVISTERQALEAALDQFRIIGKLAKEPAESELAAMEISLDHYIEAGLLGIAKARLDMIRSSVKSFLKVYLPMIPGREPSKEVKS